MDTGSSNPVASTTPPVPKGSKKVLFGRDQILAASSIQGIYVIVIAREPGIYGSKLTESEGVAGGQGRFTLP